LAYEQTALSKDMIDSVLRHREVGRVTELSAPLRINVKIVFGNIYKCCRCVGKAVVTSLLLQLKIILLFLLLICIRLVI
jgi:hypothetical protein